MQIIQPLPDYIRDENGAIYKLKRIDLGGWDMDLDADLWVNHGLSDITAIIGIWGAIRNDVGDRVYPLTAGYSSGVNGWVAFFDGTQIKVSRRAAGPFDSVDYDDDTINRGYLMILYIP